MAILKDKLDLNGINEALAELIDDTQVPKNIKDRISSIIEMLNENKEASIKIDKALQVLDDVGDDPNLPSYTRTQIWNIVSMLEKG